jgi:ribosomal protein L11 methyltransferase
MTLTGRKGWCYRRSGQLSAFGPHRQGAGNGIGSHWLRRRPCGTLASVSPWTAVTLVVGPEWEDALSAFLVDHGAPGLECTVQGPAVALRAHFSGAPPLREIEAYCAALSEIFPRSPVPQIRVEEVDETAWADNWREHFPPLSIGARLYVHPPWEASVPSGRIGIEIDPGMAFGTGHHASTRGCLVLLEAEMQRRPGARVLDIGTGSGILAIAAIKLGADEVWAVDVDPDACRVAAENLRINDAAERVQIRSALADVPGQFDVVLANLFAGQLVDLAGEIRNRLLLRGLAIGAGILAEEAAAVEIAWRTAGLVENGRHSEEGWIALAFRRDGGSR